MGPGDYKYGILENGRMPYGWQPFAVRTGKKFKDRFFKKEGGAKEYYDVFGRKIENGSEVTEICQRWLLEDLEENLNDIDLLKWQCFLKPFAVATCGLGGDIL